MATSILVASSEHNTRITLSGDHDRLLQPKTETTAHDQHQTSRKSSSSTTTASARIRKPSSRGNESKKKQPQRGMGVAQLERLRIEERWKKMTEINQSLQPLLPYAVIPRSNGHNPTSLNTVPMHLTKLGVYPLNLNQPAVLARKQELVFDDKFKGNNLYGIGVGVGNGGETSLKELSSTPNLIKSYSDDHCSICHGKRSNVSGENLMFNGLVTMPSLTSSGVVGKNVGNSPYNKGINQDFVKNSIFHAGTYSVGGTIGKGVEIVAVHTKASSSGGGSGRLLLEYEFIPSGRGGSRGDSHESDQNDELMKKKKKVDGSESSSPVDVAVMGCSGDASCATTTTTSADAEGVAVDDSNFVDLSLRLSY